MDDGPSAFIFEGTDESGVLPWACITNKPVSIARENSLRFVRRFCARKTELWSACLRALKKPARQIENFVHLALEGSHRQR